jgi:hypothetical protein
LLKFPGNIFETKELRRGQLPIWRGRLERTVFGTTGFFDSHVDCAPRRVNDVQKGDSKFGVENGLGTDVPGAENEQWIGEFRRMNNKW